MRLFFWLLPYLALACLLAATPVDAWAQTSTGPSISGIEGAVLRCEESCDGCEPTSTCNNADNAGPPTGNQHPSGVIDSVINFEDCEANLYYQFELGISAPSSSYNLEAWVGTEDCSQLANRQTDAVSVCWPVAPFTASLVNPFLMSVRARDMVSGAFATTHPVTFTPVGLTNSDDAVCQAQSETGPTALILYMFFADAEGNPTGTVQQYPITVDMRAGNVQGNITIGVGDTVLIVTVPPTTDPDTQGYNVYCDPPPGQESATSTVPIDAPSNNGLCPAQVPDTGVESTDALAEITDAGSDDSAGAGVVIKDDAGGNTCGVPLNDAGIPSPGGCSASSVLVPGGGTDLIATTNEAGETVYVEGGSDIVVEEGGVAATGTMVQGFQYGEPYAAKYLCGYGGATSTTINVTGANGFPLKDYDYYNIAVACVDGNGNVGPLSNVPCGEPVPVADFWYQYYEAGGRAGGFCSIDGVGLPAGTTGLGLVTGAAMIAMLRRRRRG